MLHKSFFHIFIYIIGIIQEEFEEFSPTKSLRESTRCSTPVISDAVEECMVDFHNG